MKKNLQILQVLKKPVFEFEKFHEKTKLKKLSRNLNPKFWPKEWTTVYYKGYARLDEIVLPKPNINFLSKKFSDVLEKRQSEREFSKKPLSLEKISALLYYSAGLNKKHTNSERRFYPSAGGRYPLEVYIISLNSDLPIGIYHYYLKNHSLEKLTDFKKKDLDLITNLKWVKGAGCILVTSAIFIRNTMKYGDKGYRHILVEAGHMAQNFYLLSTALDISCSAIGAYVEDEVDKTLDVNGLDESVIYLFTVGEKVGQ